MKRTPIFTLCLMAGYGFFLGALFTYCSHDVQVGHDQESVKVAMDFYNVMMVKARKQGPIRFISVVLVALIAIRQIISIKKWVLGFLFLLNNIVLAYVYFDTDGTILKLVSTSHSQAEIRSMLAYIKNHNFLMVTLLASLLILVVAITRIDRQEGPPHKKLSHKQQKSPAS